MANIGNVEIAIHQHGGFLGASRQVEVKAGVLTVTQDGVKSRPRHIDPRVSRRLEYLAARIASKPVRVVRHTGPTVSDSMETKIDIRHGRSHRSLSLTSHDEAPAEVWDLVQTAFRATQ